MVCKKEGATAERFGAVEELVSASRDEAARQAAARVALQQRTHEAQKDVLQKCLAVWGLAQESRYPDQSLWWEGAIEEALADHLPEKRDLVGVDLAANPRRVIFRTTMARAKVYDRYVTSSKGLGKQDRSRDKEGKRRNGAAVRAARMARIHRDHSR